MKSTFPFSLTAAILIVGSAALALGHFTRRPAAVAAESAEEVSTELPVPIEDPVDYTRFQPTHCEVHHIEMRTEEVPIQYGEPYGDRRLDKVLKLFPNGVHWTLGGCCITFDSPKSARIRICSECERGIQNISVEAE